MGDYGQYVVPKVDNMVNFKVGQPATSMLPLEIIRECSALKFAETDPMFLQYGNIKGYPKFRLSLATFLSEKYNTNIDPEELFVTNGVTGGLSLICSLFTKTGDIVFLEEPSYFLALSIMEDFKLKTIQIPMEKDGINTILLEKILVQGVRPKFLYTIPTCHNPTGRTMSVEKRKKVLELSKKYNFIVIADEVYQVLSFPGVTPPSSMFTLDTEEYKKRNDKNDTRTVLALGSFSKILAPALRLGWIQGSCSLLKIICDSGQLDSSGGINPIISGIVHQAIITKKQHEFLENVKQILYNKAKSLMDALDEHLPANVSYEKPNGGYFILVNLPLTMHAGKLLNIASSHHQVLFLPGSAFADSMSNFLRLSFSWYTPEELKIGAKRLANAIIAYENEIKTTKYTSQSINKRIKIGIHGHNGRLGSLIKNELLSEHNMNSYSTYVVDSRQQTVHGVGSEIDTINGITDLDTIIDVSMPDGTKSLLLFLNSINNGNKYPVIVIGTTGQLPMDMIHDYASKKNSITIKSNFSCGIPLVNNLVKYVSNNIDNQLWNCEISEIHHTLKKDAPSGTAKTIKKNINATGFCLPTKENDTCNEIDIHSLRLGDEFGQHTVYFAGPGERIEIKHQATRREVFAIGAIRAVEWILKQPKRLYNDDY